MKIKNNLSSLTANKLSIKKNNYTLIIGETPSKGARSPKLWNKVYKKFNQDLKMYPADVSSSQLYSTIKFLKDDSFFLGGSITTPFKEKILKYVNKLTNEAKTIGSINTIKKVEKNFLGSNTDYYGAFNSLNKFKKKKNILILGCGGAGKAVIVACIKKFKNASFFLYNRDKDKLVKFLIKTKIKKFKVLNRGEILNLKNIDLLVNTTSIGFDSRIKKKKYIL